jgi:hypothetical protein
MLVSGWNGSWVATRLYRRLNASLIFAPSRVGRVGCILKNADFSINFQKGRFHLRLITIGFTKRLMHIQHWYMMSLEHF